MKSIVIVLLVTALGTIGLSGQVFALGVLAWIDEPPPSHRSNWEAVGVPVRVLSCDNADCVTQALRGSDEPIYLVAGPEHTSLVQALYESGVSQDQVRGIILLRAKTEKLSDFTVASDAPPLMVLAEQTDPQATLVNSRRFAASLRAAGGNGIFMMLAKGGLDETTLDSVAMGTIWHFLGETPGAENLRLILDANAVWPPAPLDNSDFLAQADFIKTYEGDESLRGYLEHYYRFRPHLLRQWALDNYQAFDLMAYRDAVAPSARYVTLRNRRGQLYVLDLDLYGPYGPVILVAVDDEPNMYQFVWYYRTASMYSWEPGVQNLSAKSLGPVLLFREKPPLSLGVSLDLLSTLTFEGISFSASNPLDALAAYPAAIQTVLTKDNDCLYCHSVGQFDARAHHVDAHTGLAQGGFALPLADYSPEVMRAFLYEQEATADKIGVSPNYVDAGVVDAFFEWTQSLRKAKGVSAD